MNEQDPIFETPIPAVIETITQEKTEEIIYILPFITYHYPSGVKDLVGIDRNKAWQQIEQLVQTLHIVIAL